MKLIPLTRGKFTKVDDEDFERVAKYRWYADLQGARNVYRARRVVRRNGKRVNLYLHRFILNAPKGLEIDHINHDPLDNRKSNLRLCTRQENTRNQRRHLDKNTPYKGVYKDKNSRSHPWRAMIVVRNKQKYLGSFSTPKQAAERYDREAIKCFGVFASPNFTNR